jgi:hypothetical protein
MAVKRHWSERWWVFLACGLAMTFGSAFIFWDLAEWEAHPDESRSMPWLAVVIYRVGGKWLLSGLALAIGVFLTVEGLRRRRRQTRPPSARCDVAPDPPPPDGV